MLKLVDKVVQYEQVKGQEEQVCLEEDARDQGPDLRDRISLSDYVPRTEDNHVKDLCELSK